mgnify:CR=1 FL=1|jgi:hypothetical protein
MGLFAVLGFCQTLLMDAWRWFFWHTRGIYSSDFLALASPVLIFLLVMWRVFGPAEQSTGVGLSKARLGEIDRMPLVDETTYGGGGTSARQAQEGGGGVGRLEEPLDSKRKKDQ